jgi:hypothetical protein
VPPRVPRVFHFVLLRRLELHLAQYLCLESCLRVNEPDAVRLHCPEAPTGRWWERVRDRVELVPLSPPRRFPAHRYRRLRNLRYRYAHETDVVRLEVLDREGGVYADLDTLFLAPLPVELFAERFVLGREADVDGEPSLCNALLIAEPGAAFTQLWRERIEEAFDGASWSAHSTLLPARLHAAHPELARVEPARSFYPVMWSREGFRRLFEEDDPAALDGAYSLHLWAHLWWARRRRDFSGFHAGLLTEEYVRAGRTTYARAARPFLDA